MVSALFFFSFFFFPHPLSARPSRAARALSRQCFRVVLEAVHVSKTLDIACHPNIRENEEHIETIALSFLPAQALRLE